MIPGAQRRLAALVVAAAVLWQLVSAMSDPKQANYAPGRDFASYYYAASVALAGGDPYDKAALGQVAERDGTRSEVHPFFYPPPSLWLVAWSPVMPLDDAFRVWFVLNELALLAACLALVRWWRPLGEVTTPLVAVTVGLMYAVAYTLELGQANFPVLALVLFGLWQERDRPLVAGLLVGLAAMAKMSPALIVLWWLLRRRWVAAGAAIGAAVATSLLTLPIVGFAEQLRFYREVLPRLGAGDYMGLSIRIELFANHSIPNLWHQVFPSGVNRLSTAARLASTTTSVMLLAGLGWLFRRATTDPVTLAAQACAVLVAMLLVPVYTYEHHLVFAIPAIVLALLAVLRGWLPSGWAPVVGTAVAVLLYDQPAIKQLATRIFGQGTPMYGLLQELKFVALLVVGGAMVRLGQTAVRDPTIAPPPAPARS